MKKREYPKAIFKRKLIKGVFWSGFFLVLFLSVVAIVRVGNADAGAVALEEPKEKESKERNFALSQGAQTFSVNFVKEYFNWENDDEKKLDRADRLSSYIASGLDEQAGLSYEGMEWSSKMKDAQVWNVESTGADSALVTVRVSQVLTKVTPPDKEAVEKAKKDKKDPPEPKVETTGPHEKFINIPVKTDGKSFVVHQIPYFVASPKKPDIKADSVVDEEGKEKVEDSTIREEATSFLNTFFKVYTTGTQEELSYYVDKNSIQSMHGIMTFKEIQNLIVKKGQQKNDYEVSATIIFTENGSKGQVVYPYHLTVTKKGDRWLVKELNHH
ncbi:conjugal transfer protein [Rossellomorea marisflavi]|uniref:Conjugal transfer protein n=1 Tax=Rossellomorea marisflavi TaxID=189381 RepID=A0A5D4RES5_9BACI|nr:conjugal transfer protein [Rossellomorea marisflavi]TYS48258.1 conjugal transfer protein [Rossellomorea marisflavi]